ncbi:Alpha/Beta hydrolase protein [Mycena latifolia]|nr:Alpha/Beta hydrolase protein [Mycena latifolia]
MSDSNPHKGLLLRAHSCLIYLGIAYGIALAGILLPFVQTYVLYTNKSAFSWPTNFSLPEDYGLAPGKTVNLYIKSADNTTLGAWFILSDQHYQILPSPVKPRYQIATALKTRPTILYIHGGGGHRASPHRVVFYSALSARLDANVFAVDYRGFGDSEGSPTVDGVAADARAAWNYLIAQGAKPEDVLIVGHSLGTGVAGLLAGELAGERIAPRGLVLLAPFTSIQTVMYEFNLLGFLPLLKALVMIPTLTRFFNWMLAHRFDTLSLVPEITQSVLIVHAEDDWEVSPTHADVLFAAFLDPLLPALPALPAAPAQPSAEDWAAFAAQQAIRSEARKEVVTTTHIPAFGTLEEAEALGGRRVALLKTYKGEHDVGRLEGVQDVLGRMFRFF